VVAALVLVPLLVAAQQPAPIAWRGVLRDPAGAPISAARVRLTAKGEHAEVETGVDGAFHLAPLPAGS